MSARELLHGGLCALLTERFADGEAALPVFDAPPTRAPPLYLVVEEPVLADWSAKGASGREGRVSILLYDSGERPLRLRALAGRLDDAIETMPGELGDGWRIVAMPLVRGRIARTREGWTATSEFRVRMLRAL